MKRTMQHGDISIHMEYVSSTDPDVFDTVILIHSLGMDMNCWDSTIPFLQKNYHILRYDLRGHGETQFGDGHTTKPIPDLLMDDLAFLLEALEIRSFHIVGHGLGGFTAVQIASEQMQELKTLTLMSVPFHYPEKLGKEVIEQRRQAALGNDTMVQLGRQVADNAFFPPTKEKVKVLLDAFRKVKSSVYFDILNPDIFNKRLEQLQQIDVPILLLSGEKDNMFPPLLSDASLHFNKHARHFIVPHASFMMQMDQPEMVSEWIHQFIEHQSNLTYHGTPDATYRKNLTRELNREMKKVLGEGNIEQRPVYYLQVDVMSGFNVQVNGQRLLSGWGKRKAKQILLYLVFQKSATREEICDVFWPDVHLKDARNRLRVALHHLKQLLLVTKEEDRFSLLITERELVFLQAHVESDIASYKEAIKRAHTLENHHEKVAVYRRLLRGRLGNPLPGFFESWFLDIRDWIENEWTHIAVFLMDHFENNGGYQQAIHYGEKAIRYHANPYELEKRLSILKKSIAGEE